MKRFVSNRLGQLARTYWQPLVLSLLALLAFSQIIAWGVAAVELKKVDNLIAQTENLQPAPDASNPNGSNPGQPNPNPPSMGDPGTPSNQGQNDQKPKVPAKNIFKKEEIQYMLTGIYLDKAVVNGQPIAVGENIGKAKLKEIGVDTVVIEEENGSTRTVEMFQGGGGGGNGPSSMGGPSQNPGNRGPRSSSRSSGGNRPAGMPAGIPANFSFKGVNAQQFQNMSSEERQKFRNNLSESERAQLREQFRQQRNRQ